MNLRIWTHSTSNGGARGPTDYRFLDGLLHRGSPVWYGSINQESGGKGYFVYPDLSSFPSGVPLDRGSVDPRSRTDGDHWNWPLPTSLYLLLFTRRNHRTAGACRL